MVIFFVLRLSQKYHMFIFVLIILLSLALILHIVTVHSILFKVTRQYSIKCCFSIVMLFFDKLKIICLWAIFILFCRRPHTSMDIFISFDFFIFFFTPFCICCFTLLSWHLCTLRFIKRDLFTSSFPGFDLVALLFVIHSAFLLWHLLTNLNLFRSTLFMGNLFTILNLSYE